LKTYLEIKFIMLMLKNENTKSLDIKNPLWMETLQNIRHDVYQLPEYLVLEAIRTKAVPEAILISEGDKIFFVPYLLRNCNDIISDELIDTEFFDIFSPYGYPGILLSPSAINSRKFLELAMAKFQEILKYKGVCSAFLRLHPILNDNFSEIFPSDTFVLNGQTVSMDLTLSEEKIWAHTRKGHQSTINKCKRLGFTARTVAFEEYYDEFIAIYEETMNRVHASELYYFDNQYFTSLSKLGEKLHLCIVELEEQIICASLFFECCGILQAHLGGTKNEFLSQSPFNLLLHHARIWGKERGNEYLHIGGGLGGSTADSLFTFKSGFSRQKHNFLTLRLITDLEKYDYLVELRAKALKSDTNMILQSNFFPAYRSPLVSQAEEN
jgi:Acetyltransferase (GNAT) domain